MGGIYALWSIIGRRTHAAWRPLGRRTSADAGLIRVFGNIEGERGIGRKIDPQASWDGAELLHVTR
jgi:hypothetical protein